MPEGQAKELPIKDPDVIVQVALCLGHTTNQTHKAVIPRMCQPHRIPVTGGGQAARTIGTRKGVRPSCLVRIEQGPWDAMASQWAFTPPTKSTRHERRLSLLHGGRTNRLHEVVGRPRSLSTAHGHVETHNGLLPTLGPRAHLSNYLASEGLLFGRHLWHVSKTWTRKAGRSDA